MALSWRLDSDRRTSAGGGPLRNCDGGAFRVRSGTLPADDTMFQSPSTRETSGVNVRRTRSTRRPHCGTSSSPGWDRVYLDSIMLNDFWIWTWASPRRSNLLARTSSRFKRELRIGQQQKNVGISLLSEAQTTLRWNIYIELKSVYVSLTARSVLISRRKRRTKEGVRIVISTKINLVFRPKTYWI